MSNPQSEIRNPKSAIRNPQSAIRNPKSGERRVSDASGTLGAWLQCGASVSTIAHLTGQPVRVRMEYRVYATNPAGDGPRSNVAEVML